MYFLFAANPTYERGKDNTVKFRNYGNGIAGSHDGQRESSNIYTDSGKSYLKLTVIKI